MKWFGRAAAALLTVLLAPVGAQAAEKVALVPVQIVNADPGNGARMTEAMAANLTRHGCQLVEIQNVRKAMADLAIPFDRPVFLPAMTRIGRQLGADFVVYARVLVQGPTVQADDVLNRGRPAMIMHVMVGDCRSGDLLIGNEVIQEWQAPDPSADEQTATQAAAASAAERLLSKLYLPSAVSGRLLNNATTDPIAGAEVFLQQEGVAPRITLTDETGAFSFREMARGSYALTTHAPRFYDEKRQVAFSLGERRLLLSLAPRPAALTGILKDPAGAPLVGVKVRISDSDGATIDTLITLADGSFGRGELRAGDYTVTILLPKGAPLQRSVTLQPGDLQTLELRSP